MVQNFTRVVIRATVIAFVFAPPSGAADNAEVGLVGATGGILTIATVEPDFDWPVLVRRTDAQPGSKSVRIQASLLVGPGAKTYPLRVRREGADLSGDISLDAFGQIQLQLAAALPDPGDYTGEMRFTIDGKLQSVTLKIARGVRDVSVVGATAAGLALTTPEPKLNWLITVRRNDNALNAREVDIALSGLVGPGGHPRKVHLLREEAEFDGKAKLQPLSEIPLRVTADIADIGDYAGEIALTVDGKRLVVPIKITRVLKDNPVRIEDISQLRATVGETIPLRVRLQETEGRAFTVKRPEFMRLDKKDGAALVQAKYKIKVLLPNESEAPAAITLEANQLLDLKMEVSGLADPGAYSGVVRVTAESRKLADKSFELGLRRGVCFAAITILIGVLLSAALRGWLNSGRPLVVLRGNIADAREKLVAFRDSETGLVDDEKGVIALLANDLDQLTNQGSVLATEGVGTRLAEIQRKIGLLPDWINLRRQLDAVQPPDVAAPTRAKQRGMGDVFAKKSFTQAEADDAAKNLATYRDELKAAISKELINAIDEFRKAIDALEEPQKTAMEPHVRNLEVARAEVVGGSFEHAPSILREARKAYATVVIGAMRDMLKAAQKPPGFTDVDWQKLVRELNNELDRAAVEPNERYQIESWSRARAQWLRALSGALATRVGEMLKKANETAKPELEKAEVELGKVAPALTTGNLSHAQAAYLAGVKAFEAARTIDTQLGAGAAVATPAVAGVGISVPDNVVESAWQNAVTIVLRTAQSSRGIWIRLIIADVILFVILSLVAVLVGLNLLYFDKPTWGGATDIAVAILWGFGLHAVAGNAFQGLQGLAGQIAGVRG